MKLNTFQRTAISTVLATLFLILVGGLVRAAGAGLGCPDWPKCFGLWIPPTSLAELPAGFEPSQFNVYKTWLEYVNRLVGVVIGLLIVATFVLSFRYRKTKPTVFYSSGLALILVLFQGWLGGQVVRSGLSEGMITLHMMLAMIIVNVLLYASFKASTDLFTIYIPKKTKQRFLWIAWVLVALTVVQLVLGTQVRESVDMLKDASIALPRSLWIQNLDWLYEVHRSFSWLLMIGAGVLIWLLQKYEAEGWVNKIGQLIAILIFAQVLVGLGLAYLDMPPALQVIHLVGIALILCSEFLFILILSIPERVSKIQETH